MPKRFNKAVVSWYKNRYNSEIKEEWVVSTTGVILGIRLLLEVLTKENDGVI